MKQDDERTDPMVGYTVCVADSRWRAKGYIYQTVDSAVVWEVAVPGGQCRNAYVKHVRADLADKRIGTIGVLGLGALGLFIDLAIPDLPPFLNALSRLVIYLIGPVCLMIGVSMLVQLIRRQRQVQATQSGFAPRTDAERLTCISGWLPTGTSVTPTSVLGDGATALGACFVFPQHMDKASGIAMLKIDVQPAKVKQECSFRLSGVALTAAQATAMQTEAVRTKLTLSAKTV